ncbi:MAG: hypothetical protein QM754_07950 [Tepidisphaeraceae bacterium]
MALPTDAFDAVRRQLREPERVDSASYVAIRRLITQGRRGDMAMAGREVDLIADLALRLDAAMAMLAKLPMTADGFPILPGSVVYWVSPSPSTLEGITVTLIMDKTAFYRCGDEELIVPTELACSTRLAATQVA